MPLIQKQIKSNSLLKRNLRLMKLSSSSSTESSNGSLSDDSGDEFHKRKFKNSLTTRKELNLGTLVKKYFNGRGWTLGRVCKLLPSGDYEVKFDVEDELFGQPYTYSYSKVIRLQKTASVRKGTKISIYWPHENKYYTAIITKELPRKKENYLVCYCHNTVDREWIDLHRHKFRILVPSSTFNDSVASLNTLSAPHVTLKTSKNLDVAIDRVSNQPDNGEFQPSQVQETVNPPTQTQQVSQEVCKESRVIEIPHLNYSCESKDIQRQAHDNTSSSSANYDNVLNHGTSENVAEVNNDGKTNIQSCMITEDVNLITSCSKTLGDHSTLKNEWNHDLQEIYPSYRAASHQKATTTNLPRCVSLAIEIEESPRSRFCLPKNVLSSSQKLYSHTESHNFDDLLEGRIVSTTSTDNVPSFKLTNFVNSNRTCQVETVSSKVSDNDADSDNMETENFESPQINVGTRVEVYWPDDGCYYGGIITKRRILKNGKATRKPYFLVYDDNESEWIDLRSHKFRIVEIPSNSTCNNDLISSDYVNVDHDGDCDSQQHNETERCCFGPLDERSVMLENQANDNSDNSEHLENFLDTDTGKSSPIIEIINGGVECDGTFKTSSVPAVESLAITTDLGNAENTDLNTLSHHPVSNDDILCDVAPTDSELAATKGSIIEMLPSSILSCSKSDLMSDPEISDESIPPRRTSRTAQPTKFFANEIGLSLTVNSSEHTTFPQTSLDECKLIKLGKCTTLNVDTTTTKSSSSENTSTDFDREVRKAALDALVKKRKKQDELSEEVICGLTPGIELCIDRTEGDCNLISETKATERTLGDDIINLREGVKVAVWCSNTETFLSGTIAGEREHSTSYLMKYDSDQRSVWIDFSLTEFKILKRKRGRPKKISKCFDDINEVKDASIVERPKRNEMHSCDSTTRSHTGKMKLNTRVAIFWEKDGKFHNGTIVRERQKGKPYRVEYDEDNMFEWMDFNEQRYELLEPEKTTHRKRSRSYTPGNVAEVQVGSHVAVWWEGEAKYIAGIVTKVRDDNRPFYVVYDDGQAAHWVDLTLHKFKFVCDDRSVEPAVAKKRKSSSDASSSAKFEDYNNGMRYQMDKHERDILLSQLSAGKQIEIWRPRENVYYLATVVDTGYQSGRFLIRNENDEKVWVDLKKSNFRIPSVQVSEELTKATSAASDKENESNKGDTSDDFMPSESSTQEVSGVYPDNDNDFVYGDVEKVKVGSRIAVWWTMDKVYYAGKVVKITEGRKPYFIKYDDNDEEWTDLRKRYFRFLDKK